MSLKKDFKLYVDEEYQENSSDINSFKFNSKGLFPYKDFHDDNYCIVMNKRGDPFLVETIFDDGSINFYLAKAFRMTKPELSFFRKGYTTKELHLITY